MPALSAFLFFLFLFAVGHFAAAVLVYLNHRFVFHGKLRRWPLLRSMAKIHSLHHAHAYDNHDPFIFVPTLGQVVIFAALLLVAWNNIALSLGLASFSILYSHRHWAIHNTDFSSKFHHHHEHHHKKNTLSNFSGIYPFIDKIFGTYEESG